MKIQPVDFSSPPEAYPKFEPVVKPLLKSRFKRLFERQFSSVLKISVPEKPSPAAEPPQNCIEEFEPSSVCLYRMVQNFIEESYEKPQQRCGRNRCNCFNGKCTDESDEEMDSYKVSSTDSCDLLKSLVPCLCVSERNLLADTAKIVDRNKIGKRKDGFCRKIVTDGLIAMGYDASICKSKWDKSPSFPAGEYEYVDVIIDGERLIIDIDFRSEFEIARATKAYRQILQTLPLIFVGRGDRLEKIITIVSEAARQSLKKKGMPFPPWRRAGYVKAKWLSPSTRTSPILIPINHQETQMEMLMVAPLKSKKSSDDNESDFVLVEKCPFVENEGIADGLFDFSNSNSPNEDYGLKGRVPLEKQWEPPKIRPRSFLKETKIVTGLASVIEDKPNTKK